MGRAYVIKKIKRKGLRIVELLTHGYITIDGAMVTYDRWKKGFDQIAKPYDIDIKKKKQYFTVMDQLRKYYFDWLNDPDAAEVEFAKAEAKIKEAAAKKIADAKVKAKKIADAKKAAAAKKAEVKAPAPDGEGVKKAN